MTAAPAFDTTAERRALLKILSYRWLLAGVSVSAIGNGMQFIATAWLTLELGKRGLAVGLLLIAQSLPGLLVAPFLGVFVDAVDRRKLFLWGNVFQGVLTLAIPVLYWLGVLQVWHLYVLAFCGGSMDSLLWPASAALSREIVPKQYLLTANALFRAAVQTGMVLGAALGGIIIAATHPVWALLIDALSFVLCAACIFFVRERINKTTITKEPTHFLKDFRAGWQYVRAHPELLFPYFMGLTLWSTVRTGNTVLPSYARDAFANGGAVAFGFIDASWAVGSVLGAMALTWFVARSGRKHTMVLGMLMQALCLMAAALVPTLAWAMLAYAGMGFGQNAQILFRTTSQELTALEFQGRVEGMFSVLSSVAGLLLYAFVGLGLEKFGSRPLYFAQGVLVLLAAFVAWRKKGIEPSEKRKV